MSDNVYLISFVISEECSENHNKLLGPMVSRFHREGMNPPTPKRIAKALGDLALDLAREGLRFRGVGSEGGLELVIFPDPDIRKAFLATTN